MSEKGRLIVEMHSDRSGYGIYWEYEVEPGEWDIGGALGDALPLKELDDKTKDEDRSWVVSNLVASQESPSGRNRDGFYWDTESKARKALAKVKAAIKADAAAQKALKAGKPWPEWAVKAKAEGWRAPKGWMPK